MTVRTKRGNAPTGKTTHTRAPSGSVSAWPKATEEFSPQEIASVVGDDAAVPSPAGDRMLVLSHTVRRLVRAVYNLKLDVIGDPARAARLQGVLDRALAELDDLAGEGIVAGVATDEDTETIILDPEP